MNRKMDTAYGINRLESKNARAAIIQLKFHANAAPTGLRLADERHFYRDVTPTGLKK
ncbi:MAG: hypothetical protein OXL96_15875 [Candidatus Poribacteria bacterium]|nr:hypothetical protein [Candidatus Poribacteria bacterium]